MSIAALLNRELICKNHLPSLALEPRPISDMPLYRNWTLWSRRGTATTWAFPNQARDWGWTVLVLSMPSRSVYKVGKPPLSPWWAGLYMWGLFSISFLSIYFLTLLFRRPVFLSLSNYSDTSFRVPISKEGVFIYLHGRWSASLLEMRGLEFSPWLWDGRLW